MLTLKRFLCALLTLCGLPLLAADSTIGNLSAKTTIPDAYVMPWEEPATQDWKITFQNLTNQILAGMASQAYAQGLTNNFAYTNWVGANYYPLANPSNFVGSAALSGYALLAGTNLFTATNTFERDALGTTITPIVYLTNATAAALGAQQSSPALVFGGQGWRSGNSTTMPVQWYVFNLPTQGSSANPTETLYFCPSISNATPTTAGYAMKIASDGSFNAGDITGSSIISSGASQVAAASYFVWSTRTRAYSPASGQVLFEDTGTTLFDKLFLGPANASWLALKVESTNAPTLSIRTGADANYASLVASNVTASGTVLATNATITSLLTVTGTGTNYLSTTFATNFNAINGVLLNVKSSFTTNFVCTTNQQVYLLNGTGPQLITLPDATTCANVIYRFMTTNSAVTYIITNATGTQTIRDGASLAYTNNDNGIKTTTLMSDGSAWWLVNKGQVKLPCASWSMATTNMNLTAANTAYPIGYDTTEVNNLSGVGLLAGTNGFNSRLYVTNSGVYMITYSAMINPGHAADVVTIWMKQDGTNYVRSATKTVAGAANAVLCQTVNYFVNVNGLTYFELYAQASNTGCIIETDAASGNIPVMPGMIVTVNKCSD